MATDKRNRPQRCPSRTTILRGQYAHNTGIVGNEPPWGGFEAFHELGLEDFDGRHLAAGGRLSHRDDRQYLNRYEPEKDGIPPG